MRIAIITDIHEDFAMLERAMDELRAIGYDFLVTLGDITGFAHEFHTHSPNANACIDLVREYSNITLVGNHDLFTAERLPSYHQQMGMPLDWYQLPMEQRMVLSENRVWLYEHEVVPNLTPQNLEFIKGLDFWQRVDCNGRWVLFSHFLQPDMAGVGKWFPFRVSELKPHYQLMREQGCSLSFVGHSHPDGVAYASRLFWHNPTLKPLRFKSKPRIVFCPAIVQSQKSSGFIIFDTKIGTIKPYLLI